MPRSWIVFDDAPLASDLVRTFDSARQPARARQQPAQQWRETVVDVSFNEHPAVAASAPSLAGPVASDLAQEDQHNVENYSPEDETEAAPVIPAATQITPAQFTQLSQAHPASRNKASQWTRQPSTRLQGSTQLEESIMTDSDGSVVDVPPRFLWDAKGLTTLDKLRDLFKSRRGNERVTIDCLVALSSIDPPRDVGTDKRLSRFHAVDATGASLMIKLWGRTADAWTKHVRPGDVVWIGGVTLSEYRRTLEGSVSCKSSSIQLCYRTRFQGLEDEKDFVFHRSHALLSEEAGKVLRIADYIKQVYL